MHQKLGLNLQQRKSFVVLVIAALILLTFTPSVPVKEQSDGGQLGIFCGPIHVVCCPYD